MKDLPKENPFGTKWTLGEEAVIREGLKRGKHMRDIASQLPGRTEKACKSHYVNLQGNKAEPR
jgi:hypothetical protein